MKYTISYIAEHNKRAGFEFFDPVLLKHCDTPLESFHVYQYRDRVFVGACFLFAPLPAKVVSEYNPSTGRVCNIVVHNADQVECQLKDAIWSAATWSSTHAAIRALVDYQCSIGGVK